MSPFIFFVPAWNRIARCEGGWGGGGCLYTLGCGSSSDSWGNMAFEFWCGVVEEKKGGEVGR